MTIEILVPDLPESVADAGVATWHKKPGDQVSRDEILVDIETDKVVLEVPAPDDGILEAILEDEGATVLSKQVLAKFKVCAIDSAPAAQEAAPAAKTEAKAAPVAAAPVAQEAVVIEEEASPSVRRMLAEYGLTAEQIIASGARLTREGIEKYLAGESVGMATPRTDKRVPMTRLRKRIAERLLEAKNNTAMLTTFNEINMKPIMDLRKKYKDVFEETHDIRLGFMSFYVKAVTEALKRFPEVNASIDGDDIVYHNYFDVSIAVSTPRGLVTPVLRDCDSLGLADIEKNIRKLALKGRDGKLSVDELTGGNFTITNGGVFGSLLSTPIINPPQAAILGMHKIQDRPMAVNGQVEILPMMYLALSYDHRLIDGKESVGFLVTIKELLEDPARLLLDV